MRPAWFTAASLTTTLPLRPPDRACRAVEVYMVAETCPYYSYPFMRAEDPGGRLREVAGLLMRSDVESLGSRDVGTVEDVARPAGRLVPGAVGREEGVGPREERRDQHQRHDQYHREDGHERMVQQQGGDSQLGGDQLTGDQHQGDQQHEQGNKQGQRENQHQRVRHQQRQPPQPQPQRPGSQQRQHGMPSWFKSRSCRRTSTGPRSRSAEFCAFTHPTFNNGQGIAVITTPDRLKLLKAHPAFNASPPPLDTSPEPLFTQAPVRGKDQGLLAISPIRTGTKVLAAPPAVLVDDEAWTGLSRRDLGVLVDEGVGALPREGRERVLGLSVREGSEGKGVGRGMRVVEGGNVMRVAVGEVQFQGVFGEAARLNHDCAPNLGYYFDSASLSLKVYAARDILPGEELTISYVDVIQDHATRQRSLSSGWGFTCTCARCTLEPHLRDESDSRVRQMQHLRRQLDDHASGGTPQKAELLVTLYELEGLQVRIYEAYYRAALEWNGIGDADRALRYARLCLDKGLLLRGEERPFVGSMREMVKNPEAHWSWRFRVEGQAEQGGGPDGRGV